MVSQKYILLYALILTLVVFNIGVFMGYMLESSRIGKINKLYLEAAKYGRTYLKHKKQLKLKKRFNPSIYYGMARNYMELKDYKHAENMFTQGLKEIPGDLDLSFGLTEFGVRCQRPDLTTIGARQYLNLYQKNLM